MWSCALWGRISDPVFFQAPSRSRSLEAVLWRVYVYMFEERDPKTGEWTPSTRFGTPAAIARIGARKIPDSGRIVFDEMIGADGFVESNYAR